MWLQSHPFWAIAGFLATIGAASAQPQSPRPERVDLGQAERELVLPPGSSDLVRLPEAAATVIVGNPRIADAAANEHGLVLTGHAPGRTNLIVLARDGRELVRASIRVGGQSREVILWRANVVTPVNCSADRCIEAVTPKITTTSTPGPLGPTVTTTITGYTPPGYSQSQPDEGGGPQSSQTVPAPGPAVPPPAPR